jgi:hypothetical protein
MPPVVEALAPLNPRGRFAAVLPTLVFSGKRDCPVESGESEMRA